MTQLSWWYLELSGNTQDAGVALDQSGSGSGHAKINVTWIEICFTIYSNKLKNCSQTTNFSHFIAFFSNLSTKHNRHHNRHNHGRRQWKWLPSTPHEALHQMDGWQPPKQAGIIFLGCWGCLWPSKRSFVPAMIHCHNIGVFWGSYTPSTAQKIIPTCLGGCPLSIICICVERKASCGALGGHLAGNSRGQQWLCWSLLAVES